MPRETVIGATRDSRVFQVRVPGDLAADWEAYCERIGPRQGPEQLRELMRHLVRGTLPAQSLHDAAVEEEPGVPDVGRKRRIEVRLTPSEFQELHQRAEASGSSAQRWIVNCVRASLTQRPQVTMDTAKALWESSYQLRSIGRNLNQVVKRLNEAGGVTPTGRQMERLAEFIYAHTDRVSALLDASLSRWGIRPAAREGSDAG